MVQGLFAAAAYHPGAPSGLQVLLMLVDFFPRWHSFYFFVRPFPFSISALFFVILFCEYFLALHSRLSYGYY
jgi:hypothetical protein